MQLIGILGGTFDPIHYGHLRLALEACKQLDLDQVRLIPLNIPPHRPTPVVSADHRVAMIEQAILDEPQLYIDHRELDRNEISYSIDTVRSLRKEYSAASLSLIIGHDAFNKMDTWREWQSLLDYVHIIVANRPGETINDASDVVQAWAQQHLTSEISNIKNQPNGYIYFIEIPMLDISSSDIREALLHKQSVDDQIPSKTLSYIRSHNLYQGTA